MNKEYSDILENDISKNKAARTAGVFYLVLAITGTFNFFVKEKLFVYGNPQETVQNIVSSEWLFITSMVSEILMSTSWILIAIALYALFRKVQKSIAVLMLSLVLVGGAVIYITVITQMASLVIINNASGYLATFDTNQQHSLALLFLEISKESVYANYICMGLWMFPFAFFVFKSGCFPKTISKIWGVLLVAGGLGYLIDFFAYFLYPDIFINLTHFAFLGDLFSLFWLLIMGVKTSENG